MKIESAQFIKSVLGSDSIFENSIPQVAFIGRSNVGKSSVINSLVNQNDLAKTSSFPGRTQMINLFLINNSLYFVDLPGYGYAKVPNKLKNSLQAMINWYFFVSNYKQKKVVLIIDASVGLTKDDLDMLYSLEDYRKDIIVVANKIDRIKQTEYKEQFKTIKELVGVHQIIPYSTKKKIGIKELLKEILQV
jgi:GTP-binding protein